MVRPPPSLNYQRTCCAEALLEAGRRADAVAWFHRVVAVDSEELTDARERLAALDNTEGTDTVERGGG